MSRKLGVVVAVVVSLTAVGVASAVSMTSGRPLLGPSSHVSQSAFEGYYDGHKDSYLITDVSSKSQAAALHINYSAALAGVMSAPAQYFVKGRAAAGQITVFGSEPGEHDYNPLWTEFFVTFKPGVTPVLVTSDNQILALAKAHKLSLQKTHIVLNAPILKVGK